ncbi:MAG: ion transporter [Flavobacteriales bacterium]|nr:ion transporter [Flavobacteriales bacterium]
MNTQNKMGIKERIRKIIFEADTLSGKAFDIGLLLAIILSVLAVMLESVKAIELEYGDYLTLVEWVFTIVFTIEYILRIYITGKPLKYVFSFFGMVDLLSLIPTYLSIFFIGSHSLLIIRSIRLLRVFRILKLARFLGEAESLVNALKASRSKIIVFVFAVLCITMVMGTAMYMIEGGENGFTSIPRSIYWAIVTLTTVGYGDIAPQTVLGQALASVIMIFGYGIIAVPTGIVGAEIAYNKKDEEISTQTCPQCSAEGHDVNATYCKFCGEKL